jgi:hypothetical protein
MTTSWPSNVFPSPFSFNQMLVIDPSEGNIGTFFPIEIQPTSYLEIAAQQRMGAQDLSLKLWFSETPWSRPPAFQFPPKDKFFGITKTPMNLRVGFFALPLPQVNKYRYVKLIPGNYYVNIQNLENKVNRLRVIIKTGT